MRGLLYVHYNKDNELDDYVIYQLNSLRNIFGDITFISNSILSENDKERLVQKNLIDHLVMRKNTGFDFLAWSESLKNLGKSGLQKYESLTLMNDTCFGPLYDMQTYFEKYSLDSGVDFWGVTNNRSQMINWNDKAVELPQHIQSYFVTFNASLLTSDIFYKFWNSVENIEVVQEVIIKYETQMTHVFEKAGYHWQTIFDTQNLSVKKMPTPDFSVFGVDYILDRKIPFIKLKAFSLDFKKKNIQRYVDVIKEESNYPIELILEKLPKLYYPSKSEILGGRLVRTRRIIKKLISKGAQSICEK